MKEWGVVVRETSRTLQSAAPRIIISKELSLSSIKKGRPPSKAQCKPPQGKYPTSAEKGERLVVNLNHILN